MPRRVRQRLPRGGLRPGARVESFTFPLDHSLDDIGRGEGLIGKAALLEEPDTNSGEFSSSLRA